MTEAMMDSVRIEEVASSMSRTVCLLGVLRCSKRYRDHLLTARLSVNLHSTILAIPRHQ